MLLVSRKSEYPTNRKFGLFFALLFTVVGVYLYHLEKTFISNFLFSLAAIFFLIAFVKPALLAPLNLAWAKFGLVLGLVISPIIIAIIFFGLITPVGLFLRLCKRDELRLLDEEKDTYWRKRCLDTSPKHNFEQQF